MGVISAAQVGYDQPDFLANPEGANLRELPRQIKRAKVLSLGRGLVGVNIMAVTQLYGDYVRTACAAGAHCFLGEGASNHFEVLGQKIRTHRRLSGGRGAFGRRTSRLLL